MAAFRDHPDEYQRLDFRLLQNSPVTLYFDERVFEDDLEWLRSHDYLVDAVDGGEWRTEHEVLGALGRQLELPDYFGRSLDALNDCLGDMSVPDEAGRVIAIRNYETVVARFGSFAAHLLDVLGTQSRHHLLFGRRLLVLLQTNDPRLELPAVGACPVLWNPREWLSKSRGV